MLINICSVKEMKEKYFDYIMMTVLLTLYHGLSYGAAVTCISGLRHVIKID